VGLAFWIRNAGLGTDRGPRIFEDYETRVLEQKRGPRVVE